jgi:hypothetical protein
MTQICEYAYAQGGFRFVSGAATVKVLIDGEERELSVVRNGKGASRLDQGEITLRDLESHIPEGETLDLTVMHDGVKLTLKLDPRNAMGEKGRTGVDGMKDAMAHLNPVQRAVLADLQLETLPYGTQNAEEAVTRLRWALEQSDRLRVSDEAVKNITGLLDRETAELLIARHAETASRVAFGIAKGSADAEMLASVSQAARDALHEAGYLSDKGGIPALEKLGVSMDDVAELARLGAVIDEEYGVLVQGVPLAAWHIARSGGLQKADLLREAATVSASSHLEDANGTKYFLEGSVLDINGQKIVFGADPRSDFGDGVSKIARNPYEIAGLDPKSAEGRTAALQYTAALAAVGETSRRCFESSADRCSADGLCLECVTSPMSSLRETARALVGQPGRGTLDNTFVDALLYSASRGDEAARREFEALAALGERMVDVERRGSDQWLITPTMREEYRSKGVMAYQLNDGMRLDGMSRWRTEAHAQIESLQKSGSVTSEWAAHLHQEAEKWSADIGFGNKTRDVISSELSTLEETTAPSTGSHRTSGVGLEDLFLVHETAYPPQFDDEGNVLLRPTGDYNERYPRTSLHFAVNHVVEGHMWRQGDGAQHAIVVRLQDVLDQNPGTLDCLYTIDSYLSPMPGDALVLPAAAVRTINYSDIMGNAGSSSADEAVQAVKATAVHEAMNTIQRSLTGDPDATVLRFPGGTHYSSSSADRRLAELADELGATTGLHQNHASSRFERVPPMDESGAHDIYQFSPSAADLANLSDGARARMMTHGRWRGPESRIVRDPNEDSFV